MDSRANQSLLYFAFFVFIAFSTIHSTFAEVSSSFPPDIAPSPGPASSSKSKQSPSPTASAPEAEAPSNHAAFADPPHGSALSPELGKTIEGIWQFFSDSASESISPSADVDPEIKKICDATDYPSLCLSAVVPLVDGKGDVISILEAAIKAGNEFAKFVDSVVKKLAASPSMPSDIASALNDCKDSFDDVLYNFQKAMSALPSRDVGTMNSMLSAVITDVGDCVDALSGMTSPVLGYGEKLSNMTSNCLAIVSQIQ